MSDENIVVNVKQILTQKYCTSADETVETVGRCDNLGEAVVSIDFPEKDFYYVYPNAASISQIIDSRWSIQGRSDLVAYSNQDEVRHLFVDGSAGTQMYRFSGDVKNFSPLLYNLLIRHTTTIPLLFLRDYEKTTCLSSDQAAGKKC